MLKSLEMKQELETLKNNAKELLENKDAKLEDIQAANTAIETLKAKIATQEQLEADEKAAIENKIDNGKAKKIKDSEGEGSQMEDIRASKEYTEGFYNIIRGKALTDEQKSIMNVISTTGTPVPKSFQNKLIEKLEEMNIMRQLGTVITTSLDTDIPYVDTKGTAAWTDENAAFNESDDTFGTITISAYKLTRIIKVSEEILEDVTFDLEGYLVQSFARAIAKPEESAFINGDGTKKPTGVFVTAETGVTAASGSAITADEIIDLFYSLGRAYRRNAVFVMNDSTLKAIRKLKDSQGNYLWTAGFNGEPNMILGKPVYTSEFAPEIALSAKAIAFGDMSYYTIADRSSRTFQRLNELYSANGQVGFRGYERVDGKLTIAEAVKVLVMAAA